MPIKHLDKSEQRDFRKKHLAKCMAFLDSIGLDPLSWALIHGCAIKEVMQGGDQYFAIWYKGCYYMLDAECDVYRGVGALRSSKFLWLRRWLPSTRRIRLP